MTDLNKDQEPILERNVELQRFTARSASMSMPIIASYRSDVTNISHTGPLYTQRSNEFIKISCPLFDNPNLNIVTSHENQNRAHNDVKRHKNLLKSGSLGLCNDPDCISCPAAYKSKTSHNEEPISGDGETIINRDSGHLTRKLLSKLRPHFPVMNPHTKVVQRWNKFFAISCLVAIFIDPLFFFVLSIWKEQKCIFLNFPFAVTIATIRTMADFIYLLHIILQFRLAYVAPESRVVGAGDLVDEPKKIAWHYFSGFFALDMFILLPLPQVMILVIIPASSANFAKNLLRATVLLQYIPRICRVLPLLAGQSATGFIFESAWANFIINLLMFVLAGHVVGSCWYLFGLQRVNQCLKYACRDSGIPHCESYRDCGTGNAVRDSDAWINNINAVNCFSIDGGFDYGIYQKAVNLTTRTSIVTRYIYSLSWGFQQISTLAGNLTPSYFEWEVLFTMAIVGLGLLLFALLIGNMQNFLLALGRRQLDMQLRRRDVEKWMSHRRLPEELRRKVRQAERFKWSASQGTDEEELLKNLPEDLQRDIRRHFFQFLKKVRIFALMDEPMLDAIFEKLRQTLYIQGNDILYKGGPVDKMVFIVRGKIESIGEDGNVTPMSEGAVCGEELLTWYLEQLNKENGKIRFGVQRLISNRTVKCLTNVEGFALRSDDLEEITSLFSRFLRHPRVQAEIRFQSPYWRGKAARQIQVAWRYRQKRLKRTKTSQDNETSRQTSSPVRCS